VFLVIFFVALLQNLIARSPVIFLKLAETQVWLFLLLSTLKVGETDMLLLPKVASARALSNFSFSTGGGAYHLLNSSEIEGLVKENPLVAGKH
jgi:hypothetical protein